jgi:hypothetical protein
MKNRMKLVLGIIALCSLCEHSIAQTRLSVESLIPKNLKPAILYWDFGSPEYLTVETIYPLRDSINSYWNVTHRSPVLDESEGNGFDYYQINEKGLKPVRSQMYHASFINYLINFEKDTAKLIIKKPTDTTEYKIKIPEFIAPEGPGTSIFLGSLPLSEGYHIEYYELNRWSGVAPNIGQLELKDLRVLGTEKLEIDGKYFDTYKINITSKSGGFTEIWALKDTPHYWVKVNHKISDGRMMKSKVVKLFIVK